MLVTISKYQIELGRLVGVRTEGFPNFKISKKHSVPAGGQTAVVPLKNNSRNQGFES
jgi:hypothetical protein